MNWDDLRFFTAVRDHGGLSGAARALGTSVQTVGRRIAALEAALGTTLFIRHSTGYRPTTDALRLADEAGAIEAAMAAFQARVAGAAARFEGAVRLAAPETIATEILLPQLAEFLLHHRGLELDLVTGVAPVGIARGEADIALRLIRPDRGALTVRRVGAMAYGLFAAKGGPADLARARLIGWPDTIDLPSARWFRRIAGRAPDIRLNHLAAHRAAIASGIGMGVLPMFLGEGLQEIAADDAPVEPLYLVSHASDVTPPRTRALYEEIIRIVKSNAHRLSQHALARPIGSACPDIR